MEISRCSGATLPDMSQEVIFKTLCRSLRLNSMSQMYFRLFSVFFSFFLTFCPFVQTLDEIRTGENGH